MSLVVGIDPGTRCGWAVLPTDPNGTTLAHGVFDLTPKRFEGGGMRYVRLRRELRMLLDSASPVLLAYEEVRRHLGADAARVYGGIVAIISEECEARSIPYLGIPVGSVKKKATGRGRCDKAEMIAAANKRWGVEVKDDNEADALWIAACALEEVGK